MTEKFLKSHDFTAKWEGGYSDYKEDRGGATNYGVSMVFLQGLEKHKTELLRRLGVVLPVTKESIKALTKTQAQQLFYNEFWANADLDAYPLPVALCFYDMRVNHGAKNATRLIQRAYNALDSTAEKLVEDGALGAKTKAALTGVIDSLAFVSCAENARKDFFEAIMRNAPSQEKFRNGWLNRAHAMGNTAKEYA